jgi:hypothetical protein
MKRKTSRQTKSRRSLKRMVRPIGMALAYISPHYAPYELRIKGTGNNRWGYLYKDGKRVWDCNGDFADAHLETWPNAAGDFPAVAGKVHRLVGNSGGDA